MKKFFTFVIIVVIGIVGFNIINDDGSDDLNGINNNLLDDTGDVYEDITAGINNNTQSNNSYVSESRYKFSKSGYLITNQLEQRRFSLLINDVSLLNGFFVLDQSKENLYSVTKCGPNTGHYESKDLYKGSELPIGIDRDKGESLVIFNDEWRMCSEYEKSNMLIYIYNITHLGYGRSQINDGEINVDNLTKVNGVTITPKQSSSSRDDNYNTKLITNQLSGTGISCIYEYSSGYTHKYLISTKYNADVTCEYYNGTQFGSTSFKLNEPFYLFDLDDSILVPVKPTNNGYFVIDVSSLPAGTYAVQRKADYPKGISYFVVD